MRPDNDPMPSIDEAAREAGRQLDADMRREYPVRYRLVRAAGWLERRLKRQEADGDH